MQSQTTPISTESTSRRTDEPWPGNCRVYQTRDQWLAARRHSIGASEAYAVISGQGASEVWLAKTRPEQAESVVTELDSDIAHAIEPVAARWFAREHGAEVIDDHRGGEVETVWYDPDCPILTATPDFLAIDRQGRRIVLEVKTFSRWMRPVSGSAYSGWDERAPYAYATQVGQQLACTGLELGALYGIESDSYKRVPGKNTATYWVDASDRFRDFLRETLTSWWERYVQRDTPPPAGPDPKAERVLRLLFPRPTPGRVYVLPRAKDPLVSRWNEIDARVSELNAERDAIKREVMQLAGDAEEIRGEEDDARLWTFKATKRGSRQFRRSSGRKEVTE